MMRCVADEALEYSREVRLRLKADTQHDINQGRIRLGEQALGTFDPPSENEFVRRDAHGRPELGGKVHTTESGRSCQTRQRYLVGQVRIDIVDHSFQTPFWQRSLCPWGDLRSIRLGTPAEQFCQNRKSHCVGIYAVVLTIASLRGLQGARKPFKDRIL